MGNYPFALRRATPEDLPAVSRLVDEAAEWLQTVKHTNQWATPWPTQEARDQRLLTGLEHGRTWIVWDGDIAVATVTVASKPSVAVWSVQSCECDLTQRAVYAHRLITARDYGGRGLGADLIDWTGLRGRRLYGANWIRIDVWTSNTALHDYYVNSGFQRCGTCADPGYPSGALFQKPVSAIKAPPFPKFVEGQDEVRVTANSGWAAS